MICGPRASVVAFSGKMPDASDRKGGIVLSAEVDRPENLKQCPSCGLWVAKACSVCDCGFDFVWKSLVVICVFVGPSYVNDLVTIFLDGRSVDLFWSLDFLFVVVLPLTAWWYTKKMGYLEVRWSLSPSLGKVIAGVVLCGILLGMVHYGCSNVFADLWPDSFPYPFVFPAEPLKRWLVILYASASTGIVEEVIFRGIVISELLALTGRRSTAVVASIGLFAGAHWCQGPATMASVAVWAVLPAIWYLRTKDMVCPIVCHTIYDFLLFSDFV